MGLQQNPYVGILGDGFETADPFNIPAIDLETIHLWID